MRDIAKKYLELGFNVLPVTKNKMPAIAEWSSLQKEKIVLNGQFDNAYGIAILCGKVSGNVECIDFDTKNDLTGTLFQDYVKLVKEYDDQLLNKVVVEQTPSGGFHFLYRCSVVEGNRKLAKRETTKEERQGKPNTTTVGMIETRGEGGYFVCSPTKGYVLKKRSFEDIVEITPEERKTLIDCAEFFDLCAEDVYVPKTSEKKYISENSSPFDDWNERGDVIPILESVGWKQVRSHGKSVLMLRPGSEHKWSASYHTEKKTFYVFSDSAGSGFINNKAYNNTAVLTKVMFNGDFSESAKWLLGNGYGEKTIQKSKEPKTKINIADDNFDFVASRNETDEYINQIRNGTFKMGLSTGFPELNEHWRIKPSNLVIINGHDNVGKSLLMWYFAMMSARLHGWRWIIYSSENKTGGVKKKIIEFYYHRSIREFSDSELSVANEWFDDHFTIIRNKELFNYADMLNMAKKLFTKKKYDCFLIDPFNSLDSDDSNKHEFDYRALTQFRLFIEQYGCGIYLNCHAVTEALRRKYPMGHTYAGFPMPPDKSDTEGGGKFSNKADDFLTIHRLVQHETDFCYTEIHVKKIKEMETGGKHTPMDKPIKLKMTPGGLGFEDMNGYNPILEKKYVQKKIDDNPVRITPEKINDKKEKPF